MIEFLQNNIEEINDYYYIAVDMSRISVGIRRVPRDAVTDNT